MDARRRVARHAGPGGAVGGRVAAVLPAATSAAPVRMWGRDAAAARAQRGAVASHAVLPGGLRSYAPVVVRAGKDLRQNATGRRGSAAHSYQLPS
jgi:hypothetical protein